MFDRQKAEDAIRPLEQAWGGTIEERMAKQFNRFQANKAAAAAEAEAAAAAGQSGDTQDGDDATPDDDAAQQG
jgi:hypothetical protein